VVRRPDGSLAIDRHGPGRGAWLCDGSMPCLDVAVGRRRFDRAFRMEVEQGAAQRLRAELGAAWERPMDDVRG
jgi:predicted RNA-binding protein YlxR (DUF448 family)